MADFTDKVTSKELFNIPIKRITCVYIVWNGYWIPFCFSSKGNRPPFGKKPKGVRYGMQNGKKSANIKIYCMRLSDTFLQLAKGTLISLRARCKRLSVTLWIPLHAESANCMQRRSCLAIYCTEKLNQNIKMETTFKIH